MIHAVRDMSGAGILCLALGGALLALALLGGQRFIAGIMVAPAYGPVRGIDTDVDGLAQARHGLAVAYKLAGDPRDLGNHAYLGMRLGKGRPTDEAVTELELALSLAPGEPENWLRLTLARTLENRGNAVAAYRHIVQRFGWLDDHRAGRIVLAWRLWSHLTESEHNAVAKSMHALFRDEPQRAVKLANTHGMIDLYRLVLATQPQERLRFENILDRTSGG